ncbi:UpxY family transcription antiterminator [Aquimarina sp. W85]|uniref:UpxY family transcription antiterminator n=1 Tax=Aquimarina rhodophyticola TaxID=3342246 RepID=UPI00366E10AF
MPIKIKTGWYVLYVRSCHEKKIHDILIENNFESFFPTIKTIRKWSDRKKIIFKPLFPSYIIVKINSAKDFNKVLTIEGSCAFIRFGKEYARVREREIQNIKKFINIKGLSDVENYNLKEGEIRKIEFGQLSGLDCEILKINNLNKIIVRIESLKQTLIATVPSNHLSIISATV